ncbi:hypothetical protein WS68_19960 [Burkholderia sp. TSV86]|nr:hypothetical protein WS68_19960 [Burkholderia sp. TSV86]
MGTELGAKSERIGMKRAFCAWFAGLTIGCAPFASSAREVASAPGAAASAQSAADAAADNMQAAMRRGRDRVSARDFGALCSGTGDDTRALQAAVDSGSSVELPGGTCIVTDAIRVQPGQIVQGNGRGKTIVRVSARFRKSAPGVFYTPAMGPASNNREGPQFRDFKVTFEQPDTSSRAELNVYPPAFYLHNVPRFTMSDMQISQATVGIDMRGDSGGARIDNLEMSAYRVGIDIDGATDSVRISHLHFWPFDITQRQYAIWNAAAQVSIQSGRCDDIHVDNLLQYASQLRFIKTASGTTFGELSNLNLDSFGGLIVQGGSLAIASSIFSVGYRDYQAINMTGGYVRCSACVFAAVTPLARPMVQLSGPGGGYLQISNGHFRTWGDMTAVAVSGTGWNTLILSGSQFETDANPRLSHPVVELGPNSQGTIVGNRIIGVGSGSGVFIDVATDENHVIANNVGVGWRFALPPTSRRMTAFGNANGVDGGVPGSLHGDLTVDGGISYTGREVDKSYAFATPADGQTVTFPAKSGSLVMAPKGDLRALRIQLPACSAQYDGAVVRYTSSRAVRALSVDASSGAVAGAAASLVPGAGNAYLCRGGNATWYRLY